MKWERKKAACLKSEPLTKRWKCNYKKELFWTNNVRYSYFIDDWTQNNQFKNEQAKLIRETVIWE